MDLTVLDSTGAIVGDVSYEATSAAQEWWYADAPFTLSGTATVFIKITYDNMAPSAGWNRVRVVTDTQTWAQTYDTGSLSNGTWYY